jgi:hypothetical protein
VIALSPDEVLGREFSIMVEALTVAIIVTLSTAGSATLVALATARWGRR